MNSIHCKSWLLLFSCLSCFSFTAWGAAPQTTSATPANQPRPKAEPRSAVVDRSIPYFYELEGFSGKQAAAMMGGRLRVGVDWPSGLLPELSFWIAKGQYGGIFADAGSADLTSSYYPAATDPQSELYRVRRKSNAWSYWLVQPAVSLKGRLWVDLLGPRFYQKARVGLGWGKFSDVPNQQSFTGMMASIEALVGMQAAKSIDIEAGLGMNWGHISNTLIQGALGRLPIGFISGHLGVLIHY